jgi:hypothetical protein
MPLRHRPVAHLLDPDRRRESGKRGRRHTLYIGRLSDHPTILPTRWPLRRIDLADTAPVRDYLAARLVELSAPQPPVDRR